MIHYKSFQYDAAFHRPHTVCNQFFLIIWNIIIDVLGSTLTAISVYLIESLVYFFEFHNRQINSDNNPLNYRSDYLHIVNQ